jgi:hypothetical protein
MIIDIFWTSVAAYQSVYAKKCSTLIGPIRQIGVIYHRFCNSSTDEDMKHSTANSKIIAGILSRALHNISS